MTRDKLLTYPRRILIVQAGDVGEAVQTLPMLTALRTRFPFVDIAWFCRQETAKTLQGHWAVNRFIIAADDWYKSFAGILHIRRQLLNFAPEIALNVQNTYSSHWVTRLSGARRRFRHRKEAGDKKSYTFPRSCSHTEANLKLLEVFGVAGSSIAYDVPICAMDRRGAVQKLQSAGLDGNYAVLNVGAENGSAYRNGEYFGLTAKYLLAQWNLPSLVIWNKSGEKELAESAVRTSEGAAVRSPWFMPGELSAVLHSATLFISSESPFRYLAEALETPCIDVRGQGKIELTTAMLCGICDDKLSEIIQPQTVPLHQKELQKKAA
ncbi:MAG: hypothetical protein LBT89_05900 [Planctomycetaceae bacterium]|jgi:ADP-heptose:LPS heptosyltransferase|nr:hypothetical protein [Planctomycetaceae bacterium]